MLLAFITQSLMPNAKIKVMGHLVKRALWWHSGAGFITVISMCVLAAGSLMMLKQIRIGRSVFIAGWLITNISFPIILHFLKISDKSPVLGVTFFNAALTILLIFYLYHSKPVKLYFQCPNSKLD